MARPHFGHEWVTVSLIIHQFDLDAIAGDPMRQRLDEHQMQTTRRQVDAGTGLDPQLFEAAHAHDALVHDHGVDFDMSKLRAVGIDQHDGCSGRVVQAHEARHHAPRRGFRRPWIDDLQPGFGAGEHCGEQQDEDENETLGHEEYDGLANSAIMLPDRVRVGCCGPCPGRIG